MLLANFVIYWQAKNGSVNHAFDELVVPSEKLSKEQQVLSQFETGLVP